MKLKEIGEFGFIRRISRGCLIREKGIIKGIGDDAAVFSTPTGELTLVTTDLLIERVHFVRSATSGFNLGYKALTVNLSDIAAMGGTAGEAFISIGIPQDCSVEFLEDMYDGMKKLATEFEVNLLGGDTTNSKNDLIINITVVGSVSAKEVLYRHTAKPGDIIYSNGTLGESRAGLHLILNNIPAESKYMSYLKNAHLLPKVYLREGRFLAQQRCVHAMIDVSDGLSSDLAHIIEESNAGARIYAEQIPISPDLKKFCSQFDFDPVEFALAGGEDYTLLFTIPPEYADDVVHNYQETFRQPLYPIGEITGSNKIELIHPDGATQVIKPTGWDHFVRY